MSRITPIFKASDYPAPDPQTQQDLAALFAALAPGVAEPTIDKAHTGMAIAAHNPAFALNLSQLTGQVALGLSWSARADLLELLVAERDEAVQLVNEMLAAAKALPQLVRHDAWDWHLHAVSPDAPLAQRISVETAMAMIDVIRADELSRLSRCADADCEGIVLDLSRNRSRRFCSTACTNRNAVAAYRARQAAR